MVGSPIFLAMSVLYTVSLHPVPLQRGVVSTTSRQGEVDVMLNGTIALGHVCDLPCHHLFPQRPNLIHTHHIILVKQKHLQRRRGVEKRGEGKRGRGRGVEKRGKGKGGE